MDIASPAVMSVILKLLLKGVEVLVASIPCAEKAGPSGQPGEARDP
jgi:hypothetical protein